MTSSIRHAPFSSIEISVCRLMQEMSLLQHCFSEWHPYFERHLAISLLTRSAENASRATRKVIVLTNDKKSVVSLIADL